MTRKTEYLITQYGADTRVVKQLRAPKGVNLLGLLERLICRGLDDETLVAACLRSNMKGFYDPFKIIDMREDHRRDQASKAFARDPDTKDPIGVYNRARDAPIPPGKTLIIAGISREYVVTEVEI